MLRAVFFDLGGTLHTASEGKERAPQFAAHLLSFLAEHGIVIPDTPERFWEKLQARAKSYKRYSEEYRLELSPEAIWRHWFLADYEVDPDRLYPIAEQLCCFWDDIRQKHTPRQDLLPTLRELEKRGYYLGVISNIISLRYIHRALRDYGAAPFFRQVLTSSECGLRKPDPRIFELAYGRAGFQAGECVYVGDRYSRDVLGARLSGTGLVVRIWDKDIPERDKPLLGQVEPDHTIWQLHELLELLPDTETTENQRQE